MEDIFYSKIIHRNDVAQCKSTGMKLCGLYYKVRCLSGPQKSRGLQGFLSSFLQFPVVGYSCCFLRLQTLREPKAFL